jgi:histone demethylase JARID1
MHRSSPAQSARGTPRRARTALADTATPLASPLGSPVAPKPPSTLISSLEIPVQGAVPIPQPPGPAKPTPFSPAAAVPPPTPTASSSSSTTAPPSGRRAPRRSKTEALAALQNAVHADGADDAPPPGPTLFQPDAAPLPAAPRLDMGTVRTPSRTRRSPASPQALSKERPFGLQDCPAFYPTPEEFRDPMSYIRSIVPRAREFGIAKIVPPETWRMPFVTDTEVCNFFFKKICPGGSEKGGRATSLWVIRSRNSGSQHGYNASIRSRLRPVQRLTFWNNCIGSINSRAIPEYLYPRSTTSPWICGSYERKFRNWVVMTR